MPKSYDITYQNVRTIRIWANTASTSRQNVTKLDVFNLRVYLEEKTWVINRINIKHFYTSNEVFVKNSN